MLFFKRYFSNVLFYPSDTRSELLFIGYVHVLYRVRYFSRPINDIGDPNNESIQAISDDSACFSRLLYRKWKKKRKKKDTNISYLRGWCTRKFKACSMPTEKNEAINGRHESLATNSKACRTSYDRKEEERVPMEFFSFRGRDRIIERFSTFFGDRACENIRYVS